MLEHPYHSGLHISICLVNQKLYPCFKFLFNSKIKYFKGIGFTISINIIYNVYCPLVILDNEINIYSKTYFKLLLKFLD